MKLNILVVDDNRMMREMVSRTVRMSALDVGELIQAGNGQEALAAMRATWIDLVLLDLNMPVMDGEAFLRALRADTALRAALVVVVSTESSQPRIARLAALGAGFVHKPFRPEELLAEVERQIAGQRGAPHDCPQAAGNPMRAAP
ncbi:MAG: response regulator [Planctomycetes bacterium]|nr:response regulator [Planctomycetota bacterium]